MKPRKNRNAKSQAGLGRIGVQAFEPLEQRLLLTVTPAGADFLVNTPPTAGEQAYPAVARNDSGSVVVVWTDDGTTNAAGVYARRCNASGVAQGVPLLVADGTDVDLGTDPAVAMDSAGNFVIAWTADNDVYGRSYNASGTPRGNAFMVNVDTDDTQERPGIAMADNGSFAVVWTRQLAWDDMDAYARWFNPSSGPVTGEILVSGGDGFQWDVDVAANAAGSSFVAVLCANNIDDNQPDIVARRFGSMGQDVGEEFAVNTYTDGGQVRPDVAMDDDGNFMVVWAGEYQAGVADGVVGQLYDNSGVAQGDNLLINDPDAASSVPGGPAVAACVTGFEVVWALQSLTFDGDCDIQGRNYDYAGVAQGAELRVNAYATGFQAEPAIAMNDQGNFVVAWWGEGAGVDAGVYARLYTTSDMPVKPSVSIAATDATAAETLEDAKENPGAFTVTRTGGDLSKDLLVKYTLSGTATNGDDYCVGDALAGEVTILANAKSAVIPVTVIDDNDAEPTETVVLTLTADATYNINAKQQTGTVKIADNEPIVSVRASDALAAETLEGAKENPGAFTVTRTGGDLSQLFVVKYTLSGSATNGDDYDDALAGEVTIPAGVKSAVIPVTVIDDDDAESTETVVLTLTADATYNINAKQQTGTVKIADNEPIVSVRASDALAAETLEGAKENPGAFTVTRTGGDLSQLLVVKYTLSGSATNGDDYDDALAGEVTIPAGVKSAVIPVTVTDDTDAEPTETVVLTLTAAKYNINAKQQTGTVKIADNEPTVSVRASDALAAETLEDAKLNPGAFTVTRTGGDLSQLLVVKYTLSGSATDGDDYDDALAGEVTIPAGVKSAVIPVTVIDDCEVEPTETVVLTLSADATYNINAKQQTGTVKIADVNEGPTDIALSTATVAENQASETGVGTLSTVDPDGGETFTYTLVEGTGSTDNDSFTISSVTLKTAAVFDHETKSSYSIRVRSTDAGGFWTEKAFAITVTDVNDAPVVTTTVAALAYTENGGAVVVDGGLTVTDVDSTNLVSATITISVNYTTDQDVLSFTNQLGITGNWDADTGVLSLAGTAPVANYQTALRLVKYTNTSESPSTATRTVSFVVNAGPASVPATRDITVAAVNDAPTDIALSIATVAENQESGTEVGTLTTVDPDTGNTFTYTLVTGTGSTDNASFTITGDTLKTAAVFDYETKSSYSIRVRSTDAGGLWTEKAFTITVTDVIE
jgi:hypothetical protein